MALIDDLRKARKKLEVAWALYDSLRVPKLWEIYWRIHNGEQYIAQERDPERRRRYQNALARLRLEYASLLEDERHVRALEQWNEAEEAFQEAFDAYMAIVREAWKQGGYEEIAEQETTEDPVGVGAQE